jgi:hypothetical protein
LIIQIVSVEQGSVPAGKKYQVLEVAYKDDQGKIAGKKILSFSHPTVFNTLKAAQAGEKYDVTSTKEGDYWNWTDISKATGATIPAGAMQESTAATKTQAFAQNANDRYETKEERAARQVMIVKQSSLAQAVATLSVNSGKDKLQVEDVLKVAETYADWVLGEGKKDPVQELVDMRDDFPE